MVADATAFEPISTSDSVALRQKALTVYTEALNEALVPLAHQYQDALTALVKVQEGYLAELGQRVNAAYQSYAETLAAIPSGSPHLESTTEGYNAFVLRYAEYADPNRWANVIAPAQKQLEDALAAVGQGDGSAAEAQKAVIAFYQDLSDALQNDDALQELAEAQSQYVTEMTELQSDIEKSWHEAVETVNANLTDAATETAEAFDVYAALTDFAEQVGQIGEDITAAYEEAAEAAAEVWQDRTDDGEARPAARTRSAPKKSAPKKPAAAKPKPKPKPATPDKRKAAKAMAVGTASMPRASWVNVPEPPAKDAATPKAATAKGGNNKPAAAETSKPARRATKSGAKPKAKPEGGADKSKKD